MLNELYNKYELKIQAEERAIKETEEEKYLQQMIFKKADELEHNDSEVSFYGPLFTSGISIEEHEDTAVVESDKDHRYYFCYETHDEKKQRMANSLFPFEDTLLAKQLRYYILTNLDSRGKNCLHYAASFGDKHFCTMIIEEARHLDFLPEVIDCKDEDQMTPLYLLSERGYRPISDIYLDPEDVENNAVEKLIKEISIKDENKTKGVDEDEYGDEPNELEVGATQIAATILKLHGGSINDVKLFKTRGGFNQQTGKELENAYTLYLIPKEDNAQNHDVLKENIKKAIVSDLKA